MRVLAVCGLLWAATALATVPVFTDDPLVAGTTPIKAVHITELRTAADAALASASLPAGSYTDAPLDGVAIKTIHITEIRAAIATARSALGLTPIVYTDASLTSANAIGAVHVQELRAALTRTLNPPVISSFGATQSTVPPHAPAQLVANFSGGTGVITNNVDANVVPVTSGSPVSIPVAQNTVFTLTVTSPYGDSRAAMTSVTTVMPTIVLTRPAAGTTQLISTDDVRCTPGPCPNSAPLFYALSASTTAVDGSLVTFFLNGSPLGSPAATSAGAVQNVVRSIANGPAQQLAAQVTDPYGNVASAPAVTVVVNSVAPKAIDDHFDLRENNALNLLAPGVLSNDALANGTTITGYGASTGNEQTALGWATATSAGGTVTLSADGSFDYAPPSDYTGTDTFRYTLANISGSSSAIVSIFVYSASCGRNPPAIAITDTPGPLPWDPHTLTATAFSFDDDPGICPSEFANTMYAFTWSVASGTKYAFDSITSNPPNASQAMFRTADNTADTLHVTALGNHTTFPGVAILITGGGCASPQFVSVSFVAVEPTGFPVPQGWAFVGDTVFLQALPSFPCESNPLPTYNWSLSAPDGATLTSTTTQGTSFTARTPAITYGASVFVTDRWGFTAGGGANVATLGCGAFPIQAAITQIPGGKPLDPVLLNVHPAGTYFSLDDDPSVCPVRFAQTYAFGWSVSPSSAGSFSSPSTPATVFTPTMSGSFNVSAHVTGSNGPSTTASTFVNFFCVSSPAALAFLTSNTPAAVDSVVSLAATASDQCVSNPQFTYNWTLTPPVADGSVITPAGSTASFIPLSIGTYTATVSAVDSYGYGSAPASVPVDTCPDPTSAVAVTVNPSPHAGEAVQLHDTATSFCSATAGFNYTWTVNPHDDGTTIAPSGPDAIFFPQTARTYIVTVTAKEPSGGTTISSVSVVVSP